MWETQPTDITSPDMTSPGQKGVNMSRLSGIHLPLRLFSEPYITPAAEASWTPLGLGEAVLLPELERLYWEGVKGELENIIWTLKSWQEPELSDVSVAEEGYNNFVHGFDTFIDQVTDSSQEFALRYRTTSRKRSQPFCG